ncbi:hypothetical protein [Salinibaculum rarum]|uniref:hypothetical protein n=1 Tax=Salinibaculum rarum TaxID=3058903 RepID=UPI00265F6FA5|nr:hypothetical protein [Salinibaculum sp. KK48]
MHTPLFYSSAEGRVVETQPVVAATALMHALGYGYFDLEKAYALRGDDATDPDYTHLNTLPVFTSDMHPVDVETGERTLRSTSYTGELNVTTTDRDVAGDISGTNNKAVPKRSGKSMAGWHRLRKYSGIEPGSEFRFTVWTTDDLPRTLRFRMGIKRSGEVTAKRRSEPSDTVTLNKFLLATLADEADLGAFLNQSERFYKGNDPRLHHFINVDRSWFESTDELTALLDSPNTN